jgi:cell division protein FtsW (lipid II flippase)
MVLRSEKNLKRLEYLLQRTQRETDKQRNRFALEAFPIGFVCGFLPIVRYDFGTAILVGIVVGVVILKLICLKPSFWGMLIAHTTNLHEWYDKSVSFEKQVKRRKHLRQRIKKLRA